MKPTSLNGRVFIITLMVTGLVRGATADTSIVIPAGQISTVIPASPQPQHEVSRVIPASPQPTPQPHPTPTPDLVKERAHQLELKREQDDARIRQAETNAAIKDTFDAIDPKDLLPHNAEKNIMIAPPEPMIPGELPGSGGIKPSLMAKPE